MFNPVALMSRLRRWADRASERDESLERSNRPDMVLPDLEDLPPDSRRDQLRIMRGLTQERGETLH